uniref:Uncharacterized protein n=1 Tax=Anguilla anguilla TaxID=7936 RepID=A0A0E9TB95_ANGAN
MKATPEVYSQCTTFEISHLRTESTGGWMGQ